MSTEQVTLSNNASSLLRLGTDKAASPVSRIFNERISLCRGTKKSNCLGTALYIVGERDEDANVICPSPEAYNVYLKKLKRLAIPIEGCLIAWNVLLGYCTDYICTLHLGLVTSMNPLLVTHRYETDGEFIENQDFGAVNEPYVGIHVSLNIAYYLPRTLQLYMQSPGCESNGNGVVAY